MTARTHVLPQHASPRGSTQVKYAAETAFVIADHMRKPATTPATCAHIPKETLELSLTNQLTNDYVIQALIIVLATCKNRTSTTKKPALEDETNQNMVSRLTSTVNPLLRMTVPQTANPTNDAWL